MLAAAESEAETNEQRPADSPEEAKLVRAS